MDNKIMDGLINEIDNMSTEEYLKYHEEAVKMKQSYDNMMKALSSIDKSKEKTNVKDS